jgi:hypothetical protein
LYHLTAILNAVYIDGERTSSESITLAYTSIDGSAGPVPRVRASSGNYSRQARNEKAPKHSCPSLFAFSFMVTQSPTDPNNNDFRHPQGRRRQISRGRGDRSAPHLRRFTFSLFAASMLGKPICRRYANGVFRADCRRSHRDWHVRGLCVYGLVPRSRRLPPRPILSISYSA